MILPLVTQRILVEPLSVRFKSVHKSRSDQSGDCESFDGVVASGPCPNTFYEYEAYEFWGKGLDMTTPKVGLCLELSFDAAFVAWNERKEACSSGCNLKPYFSCFCNASKPRIQHIRLRVTLLIWISYLNRHNIGNNQDSSSKRFRCGWWEVMVDGVTLN